MLSGPCGECAYRRREAREAAQASRRSGGSRRNYDGGYGTMGSQSVYYDSNEDGSTNVFPDGMPSERHTESEHDKLIVEKDGEVTYFRENGETTMDSRNYHG